MDAAARRNKAPHADVALANAGSVDDAAVGDDGLVNRRPVDLRGRQKTRARVDRRLHLEEVKLWQRRGHVQVGLEEGANRADVLPVTLVHMGVDGVRVDGARDDVLAEVCHLVLEQLDERLPVEQVDTHRREVMVATWLESMLGELRGREPKRIEQLGRAGLFNESADPALLVVVHDAKTGGIFAAHRDGGHGQLRLPLKVRGDDLAEVHPVKLVPAQDQHVLKVIVQQVNQVLADGIGRALVPRVARRRLLRREDVDKPARKVVKLVRVGDVPVQRGGIELGQQVNLVQPGVDAVRNWDVHQAILPRQRHCRLGAVARQWEKA